MHWCASCHQVTPELPAKSPAPPFMEIGRKLKYTRQYIKDWVTYPHSEMPNFQFSPEVLENLASYILSFREDPATHRNLAEGGFHEDLVSRKTNGPDPVEGLQFASGSGFFVSRKGHVLTTEHLFRKCDQITVSTPGGARWLSAELVKLDSSTDLALLKVDFTPDAIAPLANGADLEIGERVASYGFPLAGTLSNEGTLSVGHVAALSGINDNANQFQMSADLLFGSSGGPVLDPGGRVIGIAVSRLVAEVAGSSIPQGANFAIKTMPIRIFLAASGIMPEFRRRQEKRMSSRELGAIARSFTVRVACWR